MASSNVPYSVVIICNNEERTIGDCIRAANQVSDDIIVVDSGSTDRTIEIVEQTGARLFQYEWQGYGANKNYGNEQAKNDWIISLDADEIMNPELISALQSLQPTEDTVYKLNSLVNMGGAWIKHCGWHPVWKHRVFNKQVVRWNDALVHEDLGPLHDKTISKLPGLLLHYSYPDHHAHRAKIDYYARLRAQEWINSGRGPSWLKRHFGAAFQWLRTYILKLGILDGKAGWLISLNNAHMIRRQVGIYDELKNKSA